MMSVHTPKISIVTPSYNQGHFLEQTILSVLEQNYANIEYSIIDGGSADNSVEIIKKYEKHLHYWVSEKDHGQSHAINKGLVKSSGDIFNWLNSDDYYEPNVLQEIAHYFEDPLVSCVSGKTRKFSASKMGPVIPAEHSYMDLEEELINLNLFQPSTFLSRKVFEQLGMLSKALHYSMDYELYIRYLLFFGNKGIKKTNTIFVNFRMHDDSKSMRNLELFDLENNAIYLALAKQFNAPEHLKGLISKQGVSNYEIAFTVKTDILNEKIVKLLEEKFIAHKDSSNKYRIWATYMKLHGYKLHSLNLSFKAILKNPFLFLNYKYVMRALIDLIR